MKIVNLAGAGRVVCPRANGIWPNLVGHLLWEQAVAGSNPAVPTQRKTKHPQWEAMHEAQHTRRIQRNRLPATTTPAASKWQHHHAHELKFQSWGDWA
jgi:hypothetical protein